MIGVQSEAVVYLENGLTKNHQILHGPVGSITTPDMSSLVASSLLQNAIKYCTKVVRKTGPVGQRVELFGHCLTQTHQMLHEHQCGHGLQPHRTWCHQLLPVGMHLYRSSKKRSKVPHPTAFGWIYPEWFKRGARNCTHLSGTVSHIHRPDMTWPGASGRCKLQLSTTCKCVNGTTPATTPIISHMFNVASPNSTGTSIPTYSMAPLDMTSSDYSGRHLSKFERQPKIPSPTVSRPILVVRRFACPHQLVGVLLK